MAKDNELREGDQILYKVMVDGEIKLATFDKAKVDKAFEDHPQCNIVKEVINVTEERRRLMQGFSGVEKLVLFGEPPMKVFRGTRDHTDTSGFEQQWEK